METLVTVLGAVADVNVLAAVLIGTLVGLVFGSIPGLTYSMALALVLPLTFAMSANVALALMLATYIGGMTGGSVSAILIGIPGTPSAAATVFDGYPMARSGRAGVALGTAVIVSVFGGLFSLLVMVVLVDLVAKLAIKFGPADIFALVFFGLSTICGLAERSLVRGFIAGTIGLMLMTIGLDEIESVPRMTFGSTRMLQGVDLVVAMIGLFAVPHVIVTFISHRSGEALDAIDGKVSAKLPSWAELKRHFWLMVRCAGIGTGIGAIPGTGGPIAAFLAYDHAKRFSKTPEAFGKGEIAGVVAPETANNAVTGGTMIPLLSLGIPGDPATAIILSGLLIHGLTPGPMLFKTHLPQIYTIYALIIVAYIAVLAIQLFGIRLFVRVLKIPAQHLAVGILLMCVIGSYAIRHSFFDVYTMIATGGVGYILHRFQIPMAPIVLGLVLGAALEREFRMALIIADGKMSTFVSSGPAAAFLVLAALTIVWQIYAHLRDKAAQRAALEADS